MKLESPLPAEAVILCGGRGTRLGRRKESVPLGGTPFLERHLSRWLPHFERVWVSAREPLDFPLPAGVETILDPPGAASVIDAIGEILRAVTHPTWIVAVDLPLVPLEIPATLMAHHAPATSVFVEHARGLEMLAGLYDPTTLPAIEELIARGSRRLSGIATAAPSRVLRFPDAFPPLTGAAGALGPFFNVNTPEDLALLSTHFPEGGSP